MKKILLGIAGVLVFASVSMASDIPMLGQANTAAVERYARKYIAHPDGAYILKGILWVESKNGRYKRGNGSYGIAQLEITTARFVADKYGFDLPEEDKKVEDLLMFNDAMNIKIAAAYLGLLEKMFLKLDNVVLAYNLGPTKLRDISTEAGEVPTVYLRKVMAEVGRHKMVARAAAEAPAVSMVEKAAMFGARLTRSITDRASYYAEQWGAFSGRHAALSPARGEEYGLIASLSVKGGPEITGRRIVLARSRYAGAPMALGG